MVASPWISTGGLSGGSVFASPNCDGSSTPEELVSVSAQYFGARMSLRGIDCGNGFEDACAAIETAQRCLGAARTLANENFPVPVDTGGAVNEMGSQFVEHGSSYLRNSADSVVSSIGSVTGYALKALGVARTIKSVADAYNQCAP